MEGRINEDGQNIVVYYRLGICLSYDHIQHKGVVKVSEYDDDYGSHFMCAEFSGNELFNRGDIVECTLRLNANKWVVTKVTHLSRQLNGGYAKYLACLVVPALYNDYIIKSKNHSMSFYFRRDFGYNSKRYYGLPPFQLKTFSTIIDLYRSNNGKLADQKLRNLIFAYVEKLSIKDIVSQYHICYSQSGCRKGRDSWDEMYVMIGDKLDESRWSTRFYDPYIYPYLLHPLYLIYHSEDIIGSLGDILYKEYVKKNKDELEQICLNIENERKKYFWENYDNARHKEFLFLYIKKHIFDSINDLNYQIKQAKEHWEYDDILFNNRNGLFDNRDIRERQYNEWLLNMAEKSKVLWTEIEDLRCRLRKKG